MTIIYYSEINLICIIILILFMSQMRYKGGQLSTDSRIFNLILWTTVVMCISDMVAGICRGQFFTGARVLIEGSNMVFYETISVVSYLWLVYVCIKLKLVENKKELFPAAIPFFVISIVTIVNPFAHWLFTIDENNLYTRGVGVSFHWIVSWGYLIIATIIIFYKFTREKDRRKRKEIVPLMFFIVAPVIASVIQMLFYGVTCSQVGITISIVAISLMEQNNQILTDALTGLRNRYGFNKYWENYIHNHSETKLFTIMIDINCFKQVNDRYGHLEGDRALTDVADAVRQSCEDMATQLFSCRYGGDEFLIAGCDLSNDEVMDLKTRIYRKIEEKNILKKYPYALSVSIGTASGICMNSDDIDNLLRLADEAMYAEKKQLKEMNVDILKKI